MADAHGARTELEALRALAVTELQATSNHTFSLLAGFVGGAALVGAFWFISISFAAPVETPAIESGKRTAVPGAASQQSAAMPKRPVLERQSSVATEFFANVGIRSYEKIFGTNHIVFVLQGDRARGLQPARYLRAFLFLVGVTINISNVVAQFRRSMPKQNDLLKRLGDGSVLHDRHCAMSGVLDGGRDPCVEAHEIDLDNAFLLVLVWYEMFAILVTLMFSLRGFLALLCKMRSRSSEVGRRTTSGIPPPVARDTKLFGRELDDSWKRWLVVSEGFGWLEMLPTVSAVKILPYLKELPMNAIDEYKFLRRSLTEDDGVYSASDKVYAKGVIVLLFLRIVIVAVGATVALHMKMESLAFLSERPIGSWNFHQWLPFIGFINQISGLVHFPSVRKEVQLRFVFTGEDAEMSPKEYLAMQEFNAMLYKNIFEFYGWLGCIVGLSITSKDVQKILITEDGGDQ